MDTQVVDRQMIAQITTAIDMIETHEKIVSRNKTSGLPTLLHEQNLEQAVDSLESLMEQISGRVYLERLHLKTEKKKWITNEFRVKMGELRGALEDLTTRIPSSPEEPWEAYLKAKELCESITNAILPREEINGCWKPKPVDGFESFVTSSHEESTWVPTSNEDAGAMEDYELIPLDTILKSS